MKVYNYFGMALINVDLVDDEIYYRFESNGLLIALLMKLDYVIELSRIDDGNEFYDINKKFK